MDRERADEQHRQGSHSLGGFRLGRSPRQAAIQGRESLHRQYELDQLVSRQFNEAERGHDEEGEEEAEGDEQDFLASDQVQSPLHFHGDGNLSDVVGRQQTNHYRPPRLKRRRKSLRLKRSHRRVLRAILDEPSSRRRMKRRRLCREDSETSEDDLLGDDGRRSAPSMAKTALEVGERRQAGGRYNLRSLPRSTARFFDPYQARISEPTVNRRQGEPRARRPPTLPTGMIPWSNVVDQDEQQEQQPSAQSAAPSMAPVLDLPAELSLEMIAGVDEHLARLKEMIVLPLRHPQLFARLGLTPPRGVLFHGPPGTGKTLLARILAATASTADRKVAFFMRNGAECLSKWIGEAEQNLVKLFKAAQQAAPSIIFFDEIDGMAPDRSARVDHSHVSLVSTLLALMDGLESRGQVIIIGATNRLDSLDPALRRAGRFDCEFYFGLPDLAARQRILAIHSHSGVGEDVLARLAVRLDGYSGADLKSVCTEASLNAFRRLFPEVYSASDTNDTLLPDLEGREFAVEEADFEQAIRRIPASSCQRQPTQAMDPLLHRLLWGSIQTAADCIKGQLSHGSFLNPLLVLQSPFAACPRLTDLMLSVAGEAVGKANVQRLDTALLSGRELPFDTLLQRIFAPPPGPKLLVLPRWSSLVGRLAPAELVSLLELLGERLSLPSPLAILCNEPMAELEEAEGEVCSLILELPPPTLAAYQEVLSEMGPSARRQAARLLPYRGKLSLLIRTLYRLRRDQPDDLSDALEHLFL